MRLRVLTEQDVTFEVSCLDEDLPVRGNVMASGDPAFDKECEDKILADLEQGNLWAWCVVKVTARWEGFEGHARLGGCSYQSEEDFTAGDSDYYAALKNEALADLNHSLAQTYESLKPLLKE